MEQTRSAVSFPEKHEAPPYTAITESLSTGDTTYYSSGSTSSSSYYNWKFLTSVKMNDLYIVSKLRCLQTGMNLIHAKVPGPHVHCYWTIAHRLENNLGVPHILQHMLWQGGSNEYAYPGLLQRIANRCFSSGLKSWVEKDHSCYHMTVAGKQGFGQLLPVAFDHIFCPKLEEATFLHEVFRMRPGGIDDGHCLQEIVEIEKDPDVVSTLELIRTIFGLESDYSFTAAGTSDELRSVELKAIEDVKAFHKKYYHLSNCCLIICGDISKDEAFSMLAGPLAKYQGSCNPEWKKPWADEELISPIPHLVSTISEYPSSEGSEKVADVVKVGLLGPHSTEKLNRCMAMRLVLEYLASGPLVEAFAQYKEGPGFRSRGSDLPKAESPPTTLSISEYEMKQTLFTIDCRNVPVDIIPSLPKIIRSAMDEQVHNPSAFNYERMVQVVERFHHDDLATLENNIAEKICHSIIPDFLYANEDSDLMFDRRINSAYTIHHFINQQPEFWKYVIQVCLLDTNWVIISAVPSKSLAEKVDADELARQEVRMNEENRKDTKRLAQRSKAALRLREKQKEYHNEDILEKFPLPPVSSIGFTKMKRYDNPKWAQGTLCNFYFDDINSSYIILTMMMDTSELTLEEKKYLVLFSEAILNSPYLDAADVFKSAEDLKAQLNKDCLQYETFFGMEWLGKLEDRTKFSCGSYPHLFCMRFQLDVGKVKEGFKLVQNVLWNTKWHAEKLKQSCKKLVLEVDQVLKLLGPVMTRAMLTDSLYVLNSVTNCVSLIRQKMFLRKVGEELPKSMRRVSKMLEGIRMTLLRPENITVHVAGSLSRMEFNLTEDPNARDAVTDLFRSTFDYTGWHWGYDTKKLNNGPDMGWMRSPDCIAKCSREQILRMEYAKVGYLIQSSPGIRSWLDQEYPLILLALQYFIQEGGPLSQAIVEEGRFAKEIDIRVSPSEGVLYFEMRQCENLAQAYGAAFDVMATHCAAASISDAGVEENEEGGLADEKGGIWDDLLLTSAKSSMIFRLTLREDTPHHMAMLSLLAYYKGINELNQASRVIMEKIVSASMKDVQRATDKYLKPLFLQPCTCAASVSKEKAIPTIKELLERCGKRLTLIPPVENSSLASYNQ